jgi:hypothetical protein
MGIRAHEGIRVEFHEDALQEFLVEGRICKMLPKENS